MRDAQGASDQQASAEAVILPMKFAPIAGLAALFAGIAFTSAWAQTSAPAPHYPRPRIEITPRPLLYRRCVEQLQLQYRPSGTVLYPLTYCWWERG
jgi:hypothetical protein